MKTDFRKRYSSNVAIRTIGLTLIALSIYLGAIVLAVYQLMPITIAIVINTIATYILFTPLHEAGHGNISRNTGKNGWLDELIGWFSGLPLFAPFYLFKILHDRHHSHTNHPTKDPDHWVASKKWLGLLASSSTIFIFYLIKGIRILQTEKKLIKTVKQSLWIGYFVLIIMLIVLALLIFNFGWYYPILLWVLPAVIAQVILAITFDWLPHHPHLIQKRYLNTRVFDIPALSSILLSQNYHLIHHLYPNIPFYYYHEVYLELESEIKEKGTTIIKR